MFFLRKPAAILWLCMLFRDEVVNRVKGVEVPVTFNVVDEFQSTTFTDSFSVLWGEQNIIVENDNIVRIALSNFTGSGLQSRNSYVYGFFNAGIKLPPGYSAGVVIAFYTSNDNIFPGHRDELDFEFLGVIPGEQHTLQTNVYLNGSINTGREERLFLWYDPSAEFHDYSILWNQYQIVFFVDNIPIRRLAMNEWTDDDYPAKPTSLYATIWDGSQWATDGGMYPVDYSKGPFEASFTNIKFQGCEWNGNQSWTTESCYDESNPMKYIIENHDLSPDQITGFDWVRKNYMFYSYCSDYQRYPKPLPECMSSANSTAP